MANFVALVGLTALLCFLSADAVNEVQECLKKLPVPDTPQHKRLLNQLVNDLERKKNQCNRIFLKGDARGGSAAALVANQCERDAERAACSYLLDMERRKGCQPCRLLAASLDFKNHADCACQSGKIPLTMNAAARTNLIRARTRKCINEHAADGRTFLLIQKKAGPKVDASFAKCKNKLSPFTEGDELPKCLERLSIPDDGPQRRGYDRLLADMKAKARLCKNLASKSVAKASRAASEVKEAEKECSYYSQRATCNILAELARRPACNLCQLFAATLDFKDHDDCACEGLKIRFSDNKAIIRSKTRQCINKHARTGETYAALVKKLPKNADISFAKCPLPK